MSDPADAIPQPPDETPVVPAPAGPGQPAIPPVPPAGPVGVPMPDDPAVRGTINDVAAALVGGLDRVDDVVMKLAGSVKGDLTKAYKSIDRQTKAVMMELDEELSGASRQMADAGVPVSYSPAERAAELDDPTGTAILDRVIRTAQAVDVAPSPPAPTAPPAIYCYWEWDGYGWIAKGDEGGRFPPESTRPTRQGSYPGDIQVVDCTPAPVPPPPVPPPPVPPPPSTAPGCNEVWGVGPDSQDPGLLAVRQAPWDYTRPPPPPGSYLVWPIPDRPGKVYSWPVAWQLQSLPAGGYITDKYQVPLDAVELVAGDPYCPPPTVPPTTPSPPTVPPASCPPPQPACPAPTVVVTCPPTTPPPPVPPAPTKPAPGPEPEPEPTGPKAPSPPVPPRPTPTEPGPGGLASVDWDQPTACSNADSVAEGAQRQPDAIFNQKDQPAWWEWVAGAGTAVSLFVPGAPELLTSLVPQLAGLPVPVASLVAQQHLGASLTEVIQPFVPGESVPNAAAGFAIAAKLGIVTRAEQLTGAPLTYLYQSTQYLYQYLNPQYIPHQADVDNLYLTNQITAGYWECLTRANGNLPGLASKVLDAKQVRPGVSEVVALRRREEIGDDAAFVKRLRQLGVVDPGHAAEFYRLSEFIPPFTDIIRMMIRDVEDKEVVAKYDYDKDFEKKFRGKLSKWAADQGISEDVALKLWRAHWDTPSNTALYEMLHRLRSDRPEVYDWSARFAEAADKDLFKRNNPPPLIVTYQDAKYLLEINDMSPGWVEPLLDISYRPITNTDARRAYEIGSLSEDGLYHAFRDNGYSDANARTLVKFARADRDRTIGTKTGVTSPRKVLEAFRGGLIDRIQADRMLMPSFPDHEVRRSIVDRGEVERVIDTRKLAVRVLNKRYAYGEMTDDQLDAALGKLMINGDEARTIIQRAQANRAGHLKEIRVQYVLDMLVRGIITVDQTADRLQLLGYFPPDIDRMIQLAGAIRTEKQAARAAAAANRARIEAGRARTEARRNWERQEQEAKERLSQLQAQIREAEALYGRCAEAGQSSGSGATTP